MSETGTNAVPNPGSVAATMRGCTCPVIDNHCGKGAWGSDFPGVFIYISGCPIHWPVGSRLGPFKAVPAPANPGDGKP